jgi:hypothetical protein
MNDDNNAQNTKPGSRVGFMVGRSAFLHDLKAKGITYSEAEKLCKARFKTSSPSMIERIWNATPRGSSTSLPKDLKPRRRTVTINIDSEIFTRLQEACQDQYKGMVSVSTLAATLLTEQVKTFY